MEKMLTVAEVAEILRVSERTIYNLLEAGNLRGVRIGRSWRIEKEALAELTRVGGTDRQEIRNAWYLKQLANLVVVETVDGVLGTAKPLPLLD
jgi:excisionase family DNA binding protein